MLKIISILLGIPVLGFITYLILYNDFTIECHQCKRMRFTWNIAHYKTTGRMNCAYVEATCKHCHAEERTAS